MTQKKPANLLRENWMDLDSHELRLLLNKRIGLPGQIDSEKDPKKDKLYLPFARDLCRVAIKFEGNKIVALEAGKSFDAAEWKKIADEIDNSILVGQPKVGRDYSFSSFRVEGSWRGQRSGLQILPPPPEAPGARFATAENPFILEFPITSAPDELREITNHRRIREHRRLTLLLNVLLTARINCELRRPESFWALVPAEQGGWFKRVIEKLRFWLAKVGWRQSKSGTAESRWLQRLFWGPLDAIITDALSPQAAKKLTEIEPVTYYTNLGNDGKPLRVPSDLDDSICRYLNLSVKHRSKFDRAIFWMDVASRQWTTSVSSSFASLVSAVEALTDRGTIHDVYCEQCDTVQSHDVPGARQKFRSFFDTYASGAALSERRALMYDVRSGILHGSKLMQIDQDLTFGFNPQDWNEIELHRELWGITRLALRNWLKNPPV